MNFYLINLSDVVLVSLYLSSFAEENTFVDQLHLVADQKFTHAVASITSSVELTTQQ